MDIHTYGRTKWTETHGHMDVVVTISYAAKCYTVF